jgi:peptide/nickel transport system permease protein
MSAASSVAARRARRIGSSFGVVGVVSTVILLTLVVLAVVAPFIWGDSARQQDVPNSFLPAGGEHLLGTDGLGRDVLARTLVGTSMSLGLALVSVVIAAGIAVPLGAALGTVGGRTGRWGATGIDISLSLPDLLLAVVIVTLVGTSGIGAALAVGLAFTPYLLRVTFVLASSVTRREFVQAGRLLGVSRRRLMRSYILPNVADTLVVSLLSLFGECLIAVSALSFLGLGVQEPATDWGSQLTTGVKDFYLSPAAALAPTLMIAVTGLTLALFADAVAHLMNPVENRRRNP